MCITKLKWCFSTKNFDNHFQFAFLFIDFFYSSCKAIERSIYYLDGFAYCIRVVGRVLPVAEPDGPQVLVDGSPREGVGGWVHFRH